LNIFYHKQYPNGATVFSQEWEILYELQLHNIGNLTLTAYNTELSNDDFNTKKSIYKDSHLEINKYFANILIGRKAK